MTNYYILVTAEGKRIPVKTKITIKSLIIANCFSVVLKKTLDKMCGRVYNGFFVPRPPVAGRSDATWKFLDAPMWHF